MPMVVLFGLLGIVVVAAVVLLATNRWPDPGLVDDPGDRVPPPLVDVPIGQLSVTDIDQLRLDTSARGYRMDEVDAVIARLTAELAARDASPDASPANPDVANPDVATPDAATPDAAVADSGPGDAGNNAGEGADEDQAGQDRPV